MMKTITLWIILCFCAVSLAYGEEVNKILVKVNNYIITIKDLDDFCKILTYRLADQESELSPNDENFRSEALEKLIEDKLIAAQAQKENIEVPGPWVEGKLGEMIASYPTRSEFEASLIERGLTMTILKKRIREQFMARQVIDKYVRQYVTVSPNEVHHYYLQYPDKFSPPDIYVLWIAVSDNEEDLAKLGALINERGIEQVAKNSGALLVQTKATKDELREEVSSMVGQIKEGNFAIKKFDGNDHLIYFEKIIPGTQLTFEDVRERIHSFLWTKKFRERYQAWIASLKEKATIKMHDQ